jgi:hypothetical protein
MRSLIPPPSPQFSFRWEVAWPYGFEVDFMFNGNTVVEQETLLNKNEIRPSASSESSKKGEDHGRSSSGGGAGRNGTRSSKRGEETF